MNEVVINYKNKIYKFPKGTSFVEIVKHFREDLKYEPLAVLVNNEIQELTHKITKDSFVEFIDMKSKIGGRIYEKGLFYLFTYAVKMVLGVDTIIKIENSIDKGIFVTINKKLNQYVVMEIDKKMKELVKENVVFEKNNIERKEAINYFDQIKRSDKADILRYISNTYITLYKFKNLYDYFYGEMPYSSTCLKYFRLDLIENRGVVISYPSIHSESADIEYRHHNLLFNAFIKYRKYQENIEISTIADLNRMVAENQITELIKADEACQNNNLLEIATDIAQKEKIKIILMAGPSSSGKTTTSKKLKMFLQSCGIKAHNISLDDFFKERYETPKDEKGEYDFECVESIDVELFEATLSKLLNGEKVKMPTFNFILGKKEYNTSLSLGRNEVLIIEGLHGLNEKLTQNIPKDRKTKIYISPLSNLNIDFHNRIHTTDLRLLRRIVRDSKTRGYGAAATLKVWKSVRKGEEKYVFPYQDEANYVFNTALIYELGVLKTYVEPLLYTVDVDDENYAEAVRLIEFLRIFLPIPSEEVPTDSILREFIGRSSL